MGTARKDPQVTRQNPRWGHVDPRAPPGSGSSRPPSTNATSQTSHIPDSVLGSWCPAPTDARTERVAGNHHARRGQGPGLAGVQQPRQPAGHVPHAGAQRAEKWTAERRKDREAEYYGYEDDERE